MSHSRLREGRNPCSKYLAAAKWRKCTKFHGISLIFAICVFASADEEISGARPLLFRIGDFDEIFENFPLKTSPHWIFREKWTVAAGRITFAKCVFAFFIFRKIFSEFHQKRPNAKSSGLAPVIFAPQSAGIAKIAKVQPRGYFFALFGKSHHILHL